MIKVVIFERSAKTYPEKSEISTEMEIIELEYIF